jgi:flagellar protein FliO/FliZ
MIGLLTPAIAAAQRSDPERTPVDLPAASQPGPDVGGGGSLVRTIVGLAIVIGVIYGIAWVLRQLRNSRAVRGGNGRLAPVASVGLGPGTSLHLVRAGNELLLLGVSSHGVTPVRTYSEEEAREAGLIDDWGELVALEGALWPDRAGVGRGVTLPTASRVLDTLRRWTVRR